ncbi:hypothetical protein OLMES_3035 [Oleiphilus messinensis]|uniref:DUF695 domain-containing protein n=1 Tax=Oleiphilus messinensis TaxID=141451 RepID=A0A1Y0I991_9GAMM|nr:DUF695 domain-containing protein [Oleiphilus messinensis]ARU57078.1 hypothetical protein OLMES_3035 [Oleiphilus messinensis]
MDLNSLEYATLRGEQNGCPITYRCIKDPKELKELFTHRIGIFWPYESTSNGLAPGDVNELQNKFEDAIDVLESEEQGILSLVVFGGGRKEWHWYVKDINEWMNNFNEILSSHKQYPLQIEFTENDNWGYHNAFIKWAKIA